MEKRTFLQSMALAAVTAPFSLASVPAWAKNLHTLSPTATASDDEFWKQVRGEYRLKPDYINLENGYYNILPNPLLEKYIAKLQNPNINADKNEIHDLEHYLDSFKIAKHSIIEKLFDYDEKSHIVCLS